MTSGILTQGAAQGGGKTLSVDADFALADDAHAVGIGKFYRVLDRDDMPHRAFVDVVEHRGNRGRFAGTRCSGDQHESSGLSGDFFQDAGQTQIFEAEDVGRNRANGNGDLSALLKDVHAESTQTREPHSPSQFRPDPGIVLSAYCS